MRLPSLRALIVCTVAGAGVACDPLLGVRALDAPQPVAAVALQGQSTLSSGTATTVAAVLLDTRGTALDPEGHSIVWTTDRPEIAAVVGRGATAAVKGTKVGTATVRATADGNKSGSLSIQVVPGSPATLAFVVQPANSTGGTPITPAVQIGVRDAAGNLVSAASNLVTVSLSPTPGGATLSGTTSLKAVNGIATFPNLRVDKVGSGYTLTATSSGLASATSNPFNVAVGAASALAFSVQPASTVAGTVISPAVRVTIQDAGGNPVTTSTAPVSLALGSNPAGGKLSGTTTVAAVSGVAVFADLSLDKASCSYTLSASAPGLATANSATFCIAVGPPQKLTFIVPPVNVTPGTSIAPAVQVAIQDAGGNTVTTASANVTLALSSNPGNTSLSGTTTASTASGVATFGNLSIGVPASGYALAASSSSGLRPDTSRAFDVVAFAKLATNMRGNHTCALVGNKSFCWGANPAGQLGTGSTSGANQPVVVSGNLLFKSVATGSQHSCGLTTGGDPYCWGQNTSGQLGTGSTSSSSVPARVSGTFAFVTLATGSTHTCGLLGAGTAYCWGDNASGQLGIGSSVNSATPAMVLGNLTFASLVAGAVHTCGLTSAGKAYCWGANSGGQLGTGSTAATSVPTAVSGGLTFASLAAGGGHTCGLTSAGKAYCWGTNTSGQLGTGSTTSSSAPVAVAGTLIFASLTAGAAHTCGLTSTGKAYCWGTNASGQLGTGSTASSFTPVAVADTLTFTSLVAGAAHTCGLTAVGAAFCWGMNSEGQLADGSYSSRLVPVAVRAP